MFNRCCVECFSRNEHDYIVRRGVKSVAISFFAKLRDMIASLSRVLFQLKVTLRIDIQCDCVKIGFKWGFRIDNDRFPPRQTYYYIRTQSSFLGFNAALFKEIAMPQHASQLDHSAQLHLTPDSAHPRRT